MDPVGLRMPCMRAAHAADGNVSTLDYRFNPWLACRFVQKQLIVEFTLNPTVAALLGWTINQHPSIAFALYVGGEPFFAHLQYLQQQLGLLL